MEFYAREAANNAIINEFQFPTGWNSTDFEREQIELQKAFQFPTGWNSTQPATTPILSKSQVSIPNGMEFYNNITILGESKKGVSIPNGMEFYIHKSGLAFDFTARFNSQRDGILYITSCINFRVIMFQFPTGWNSILL